MLRKRNLPACAAIPNIKFDIEAMKQELKQRLETSGKTFMMQTQASQNYMIRDFFLRFTALYTKSP